MNEISRKTNPIFLYYRGLLRSCNYRCSYCPFSKTAATASRLQRDELALNRFCEQIEKPSERELSIMIVPYGEALIHPYYADEMARLCAPNHVRCIACQTNLSFPVSDFVARTTGFHEKIRLWCSFHPGQTEVATFHAQCMRLYESGIRFSVGAVGIPANTQALMELRHKLPPEVYLWVNAPENTHTLNGVKTEQVPEIVPEIARPAANETAEEQSPRPCAESFFEIDPYFYLETEKRPADAAHCIGGRESFFIEGNGDIYACNISRVKLGNLYTDADGGGSLPPRGIPRSSSTPSKQGVVTPYAPACPSGRLVLRSSATPSCGESPATPPQSDDTAKKLCKAKECHCYLAYVNRNDGISPKALDAFGEGRFCRVPDRNAAIFFDIDEYSQASTDLTCHSGHRPGIRTGDLG